MACKSLFAASLALCALLIAASGAEASRRSMSQATATSIATADASNGGTAVVTSNTQATSTGAPTSATAVGTGSAGAGQTVVVDCNLAAKNEELQKYCVGVPTSSSGASATAAATSWESAPACTGSPVGSTIAKDSQGKPWGYENGKSCAYRNGTTANAQAAQAIAAASSSSGVTYEAAPACSGDPATSYSVKDASGRLWGYENGKSCVFRGAATSAAAAATSAASPPATSPPANPAPAPAPAKPSPTAASATANAAANAASG